MHYRKTFNVNITLNVKKLTLRVDFKIFITLYLKKITLNIKNIFFYIKGR